MFRGTVRALNLDEDFYVPKRFKEQLEQRCKNVHTQFTHTHLLLVNGDKDPLFPPAINESLLEKLRTGRLGREGTDWKQVRVPEGQHFISKDYIMEATRWTHTWMSQPTVLCEARL
jgi:predicted esterase